MGNLYGSREVSPIPPYVSTYIAEMLNEGRVLERLQS